MQDKDLFDEELELDFPGDETDNNADELEEDSNKEEENEYTEGNNVDEDTPKDETDELADIFEEQEKNSKGTKKGGKKSTTTPTTAAAPKEPVKPKDLTGYKVVVYGDELFTVEEPKTTEEDIRKTLEETYQYIEFSKNKTVIHVNEDNKVITPHVKFQNKG